MTNEIKGKQLILHCEEDLLSTTVNDCVQQAQTAIEKANDVDELVIDMEGVNTVDSQGLNFLVGLYQECQSMDWKFSLIAVSSSLKQLFDFVKLSERFGIDK